MPYMHVYVYVVGLGELLRQYFSILPCEFDFINVERRLACTTRLGVSDMFCRDARGNFAHIQSDTA